VKKLTFILLIMILLTAGCNKKENTYEGLESKLKAKLIKENYLDERNFSSLKIIETIDHGYYKESPEKKYTEVHFT